VDKQKHPGGAPTKYKREYNAQVEKLCKLGATDAEIAEFFDVCEATVNNWKIKEPQFLESLKRGKMLADMNVAESLYKKANGYERNGVKVFQHQGNPVIVPYIEHYPPDTAAIMAWLNNRRPKQFRNKHEIEHSGELKVSRLEDLIE
jgi:hypothetical protein